jgi:hypothetical protein
VSSSVSHVELSWVRIHDVRVYLLDMGPVPEVEVSGAKMRLLLGFGGEIKGDLNKFIECGT